ncbi:MAG: phosphate ABC transporter permease subunit PstC [Actinomycetes bacterium]
MSVEIRRNFSQGTKQRLGDRLFFGTASAAALFAFGLVALILIFLGYRAWPTFSQQGFSFITGSTWEDTTNTFQIFPMLVGSIYLGLIGLLIAVPCSIFMAYYIEFVAPARISKVVRFLVDFLAAIPSIIIGFWGLVVFTPQGISWAELINKYFSFLPIFKNDNQNFGGSPFIGGWILGVMMIPIITSVSREVMSRVDPELVNAGRALGGGSFSILRRVILPVSKGGVLGGVLLGLGRGLGETIAILYTVNLIFVTNLTRPLESRGGSIASWIAASFGEATSAVIGALMAAGVVLFAITLIINILSSLIVERSVRKMAS